MLELSDATRTRLEKLFPEESQREATSLLEHRCGINLPGCADHDPHQMERIRFAALKLSQGDLIKLEAAVELAESDWRDLLMAAGFAEDVDAHQSWMI